MPPVGFELTISASERPQTYALDRATTGIGDVNFGGPNFKFWPEGILRLVTKNNIPVLCTIFVLPPPLPHIPRATALQALQAYPDEQINDTVRTVFKGSTSQCRS